MKMVNGGKPKSTTVCLEVFGDVDGLHASRVGLRFGHCIRWVSSWLTCLIPLYFFVCDFRPTYYRKSTLMQTREKND